MKNNKIRQAIREFDPYKAGLNIEEIRERYGLDTVIKLASNENPLGASPVVQKALSRALPGIFRYSKTGCPRLAGALAERLNVPQECVLIGNGSDEVIDMLIRMAAEPGRDEVICYEHSFSMYRLTARLCGVDYREVPREDDQGLPLSALGEAAGNNTAMVVLTSPDNPTGLAVKAADVERLAKSLPQGTLLVVDEAYIDFTDPVEEYSLAPRFAEFENLVILRTFSKAFGLAGMRLGFGLIPSWLTEYMNRARIPFTVNVLAEEAGLAALKDEHFLKATLETVDKGRKYLTGALEELGCKVWPSQANFLMFRPPADAGKVFEDLLKKGIIVRHLKSFGLGDCIRVNMGAQAENEAFISALKEVLGK